MDKFWITQLVDGKMYEVEISGWVFFPKEQITRALLQIQKEYGNSVSSIHRFPGMWNHHYLVFTV